MICVYKCLGVYKERVFPQVIRHYHNHTTICNAHVMKWVHYGGGAVCYVWTAIKIRSFLSVSEIWDWNKSQESQIVLNFHQGVCVSQTPTFVPNVDCYQVWVIELGI